MFNARTELPDLFNFDRHYAPPAGGFFVIRNNGRVAASIGVERNGDATAELHRLYVDPEFRSLGWGRALVERTLQWCRNNGIRHIFLWSDTRLDFAHMLYTSMGFTRTDRRPIPKDINNTWEYRFDREI